MLRAGSHFSNITRNLGVRNTNYNFIEKYMDLDARIVVRGG